MFQFFRLSKNFKIRGLYRDFSSQIFFLAVPKKFSGEPYNISLMSRIENFLCIGGVYYDFSSQILSHSTEKNCGGTLRCFSFSGIENFMHKRGISRLSVEDFLSHSTEKLRRATLLCFRKILISKIVRDNREIEGGWVSRFSVEIVSSDSTEPNRRGITPFCVSEKFQYRKVLWMEEWGGWG